MAAAKDHVRFAIVEGLPLVGNAATGAIAGLTPEAYSACLDYFAGETGIETLGEADPGLPAFIEAAGLDAEPTRPAIATAYLHVTQRCNMDCMGCYSRSHHRNTLSDPSDEELDAALSFLAKLGTRRLVVSGGEPFLRDDLSWIVSTARQYSIATVEIVTNGTLISREKVKGLSGLVDAIAISYSGDETQGERALGRSLTEGQLGEALYIVKDAGVTPEMLVTLHSGNAERIGDFIALGQRMNVPVRFSMFTCPPGHDHLSCFEIEPGQLNNILDALICHNCLIGDEPNSGLAFRDSCGIGRTSISVDADGTIYPCHMMHSEQFAIGCVFSDSTDQLLCQWFGNPFQKLSAANFEKCKTCEYCQLCGGGCRARAFARSGNLQTSDPLCRLSYEYYRLLIDSLKP